mgnify:CR=1 FL=1
MKKLIIFTILLFGSSYLYANDWEFDFLYTMNESCLEEAINNVSISQAFEYCGCTTNNFANNFTVDEALEMFNNGTMETNVKMLGIVELCNSKIGY